MLDLLINSAPTIIAGVVVALALIAVILKMIRDKKKGKSSCGCNCADCPASGMCHTK